MIDCYTEEVKKRDLIEDIKTKYSLTEEEIDALDYAIFLIQCEIDGEVE